MTSSPASLPLHHDGVPHPPKQQQQQQQQQHQQQEHQQQWSMLTQLHQLPYHLLLVAAVTFMIGYLAAYSPRSAALAPQPAGRSEYSQSRDFSQADASSLDTSTLIELQQTVSPRLLNSSPSEQLPNDTCAAPIGVRLPHSSSSTSEPLTAAPEWIPLPNRYLMVSCTNGRSTNRLLCFQKTILAAILLNRTLLVPEVPLCLPATLGRPVVYSEIIDIGYLSQCFGERPSPGNGAQPVRKVITGSDFLKSNGGKGSELVVDKVLCGQVKNSCHFIDSSCGEAKEIKLSEKEIVSEEKGKNLFDLAPKIAAATANVPVLSLGDLFYSFFNDNDPIDSTFFWPSRFFNTSCELLFRPPQHVLNQASAFIKEYLGVNYASMHLRRTDFLDYSRQVGLQYWPLQAVAECTASKMVQLNVTSLFVSSDASDEELEVLKELLQSQGSIARARGYAWSIVVVRLPKELNIQPGQLAIVDKLVAAHAMVTMTTQRSTFSRHIGYLRESLGLASCHDGLICEGKAKEAIELKFRR